MASTLTGIIYNKTIKGLAETFKTPLLVLAL